MNSTQELHAAGQSIWYDNIQRSLLRNGELAGIIQRKEIRGVTSNPTIFMNAITKSQDYDAGLVPLAQAGRTRRIFSGSWQSKISGRQPICLDRFTTRVTGVMAT